eukprot:TRINITY_DN114361_c0_g1_i1.p1 TRINITY_DN114361_c0_g1~~TRINITY_DN114361_c0_g1_i1.p1  ORF type:complete len:198 (+),score=18.59 TRINITY_DN114361_c0_g1_i1:84-677(+)
MKLVRCHLALFVFLTYFSPALPASKLNKVRSCREFNCSDGWKASETHHMQNCLGECDDDTCCDKTCKLWTCGPTYVANEAYAANIDQSDEECCDVTCDSVQCGSDFINRGNGTSAHTHADCCLRSCGSFPCTGNYSRRPNAHLLTGNNLSACCAARCILFDCDETNTGWVSNRLEWSKAGSTKEECCMPNSMLHANT